MQGMVEDRGVAGNQSQPKESQPATLVTPCPAGTCGRALPCPGFDRLHSVMPYDTTLVADRHLLDGVARGEADALRALHQRYGESIYALVYGVLVDPGEAEEGVGETFAHLWRTAEIGRASCRGRV